MDNDLLIQLLEKNNRLIIPTLGAFLKKELPSGEQIVFTPFLKKDDGVLLSAIAENFGIELQDATSMIEEFVEQIKFSLQENGSYIFAGIGTLKTDANGVIIIADQPKRNTVSPIVPPIAEPIVQQPIMSQPVQPIHPQPVIAQQPFIPQPVQPQPIVQQPFIPQPIQQQPIAQQPMQRPMAQPQPQQRVQPAIARPQIPQPKFPTPQPQQRPVNIPQQPQQPQQQRPQRPVQPQPMAQGGAVLPQQRRPMPPQGQPQQGQPQQGQQPQRRPMQRGPKPKSKIDIWLIIAIVAALIVIALIIYGYLNTETNLVLPPEVTPTTTVVTDTLP